MRFFIHTITDEDRVVDEEGACFANPVAALREAERGAREIMAAEILAGRPLPLDWIAEVMAEDNVVVGRITFLDFVRPSPRRSALAEPTALAKNMISRSDHSNRRLEEGLTLLSRQLNTLSQGEAATTVSERSSGGWRAGSSIFDPKGLRGGTK